MARANWSLSAPFLTALGLVAAGFAVGINYAVAALLDLRKWLADGDDAWLGYLAFSLVCAMTSLVLVQRVCPAASGSGIPQMKAVVAGIQDPECLSLRALFTKTLGLICSYAAGLSAGREGPFVHIACTLANQLMRLPVFRSLQLDMNRRLDLLGCAAAAGVACTFGTPFGGVLFSIEVTSSTYSVRRLPDALYTAMCGSLVVYWLHVASNFNLFTEEAMVETTPNVTDSGLLVLLGVMSGLLGAGFVTLLRGFVWARLRWTMQDRTRHFRQFVIVVAATLVSTLFVLLGDSLVWNDGGQSELIDRLFQEGEDADRNLTAGKLMLWVFTKLSLTALCSALPLPVGLFTPVFLCGGALGRSFGNVLVNHAPGLSRYSAAQFAVVGAAGVATGVTRAISTAVIVTELAGDPQLQLPVIITTLTAYYVGNATSRGVYEVLLGRRERELLRQLHHAGSQRFTTARSETESHDYWSLASSPNPYDKEREVLSGVSFDSSSLGDALAADLREAGVLGSGVEVGDEEPGSPAVARDSFDM